MTVDPLAEVTAERDALRAKVATVAELAAVWADNAGAYRDTESRTLRQVVDYLRAALSERQP